MELMTSQMKKDETGNSFLGSETQASDEVYIPQIYMYVPLPTSLFDLSTHLCESIPPWVYMI